MTNIDQWVESVGRVIRWIGVATVFIGLCILAGYCITKLEKVTAKPTTPDCGSCRPPKDKK